MGVGVARLCKETAPVRLWAGDRCRGNIRSEAWVQHRELSQEAHEPEYENDGDRNTDQPEKTAFEHFFASSLGVKTKRGGDAEVPPQTEIEAMRG